MSLAGERVALSVSSPDDRSRRVAWTNDMRVELVDYDDRVPRVRLIVERVSDRPVGPGRKERVERGASIALDESWTMTFTGHGHKSVMAGQTSPLIVSVEMNRGAESEAFSVHLFPPDERTFRWRDYEFELLGYGYDEFMVLAFTRLELEPVGVAR